MKRWSGREERREKRWKGKRKGMKEGWESGGKAKIFHVYFVYGIHVDEGELGVEDYN